MVKHIKIWAFVIELERDTDLNSLLRKHILSHFNCSVENKQVYKINSGKLYKLFFFRVHNKPAN